MLSWEKLRTRASLWAIFASSGQASVNCTPGRLVEMVESVPRISSGASGLGSNESMCVTPPPIHKKMTDRALPFVASGPAAAWTVGVRNKPGIAAADSDNDPIFSKSRRGPDISHGKAEPTWLFKGCPSSEAMSSCSRRS